VPHHKSAKKRIKTNEISRERNIANRTVLRHAVRDLRGAMEQPQAAEVTQKLGEVESLLDKMGRKGIIHPNKAARLKSRLHHKGSKAS
jgi:small subunit ribosomal protein S20